MIDALTGPPKGGKILFTSTQTIERPTDHHPRPPAMTEKGLPITTSRSYFEIVGIEKKMVWGNEKKKSNSGKVRSKGGGPSFFKKNGVRRAPVNQGLAGTTRQKKASRGGEKKGRPVSHLEKGFLLTLQKY